MNFGFNDGMGDEWVEPESLEEKRKLYKCKKFFTIKDIETWEETKISFTSKNSKFKYSKEINKKVSLFKGDATTLEIDAIVNAASPGFSICQF
jgi:O-acetyl-ADP-ribose deacetylase